MQDIVSDLLNSPFAIVIVAIILIVFLILILFLTRYKVFFKPNQYVIWLRRGRVRRASIGGSTITLPIFDEIYTIPTMLQIEFDGKRQSLLKWIQEYKEKVPEELLQAAARVSTEKKTDGNLESEMGWIKILFDTGGSHRITRRR